MVDGNDTCTCLRHFGCGVDKLFIFVFISVNENLTCPILSTECVGSGRTNSHVFFGEKKNAYLITVTLACTSFPVPVGTIYVVLMI